MSPGLRTSLRWAPTVFLGVVMARVVVLAWTAASRGIDFTDEGIYLVSYRYYHSPEMVYTGAPAFFGPLFQLVGYSVVSLRRVKLILILICGLGLGWSTAAFVSPRPVDSRWSDVLPLRIAIAVFVTIGGFTMYTWLPQSPGYNDLSVLCAMALAAVLLPAISGNSSGRRWWLVAAGAVTGIAMINKWPAGLCMVGVVVVAVVLALGWRGATRCVGWSAAGVMVGSVLLAVVSGGFFDRLTELRSASEQITNSLPIWDSYLVPYWRNVVDVVRLVGAKVWLVLAVGVGLSLKKSLRRSSLLGGMLVLGVLLAVNAGSATGMFRGGNLNVQISQVALPLFLVLAAVVWLIAQVAAALPAADPNGDVAEWVNSREGVVSMRVRGAAVMLLVGLGGAQAFGTLNPPMYAVVSSGALFAAAIVIVAANSVNVWRPATFPLCALLIMMPLVTERMMQSGLWQHPYELGTDLNAQNVELDSVIGYKGISTDSGTAELLHNLSAIANRRGLVGRPGLSVSFSPGYALALGLTHPPADLFISSADYYAGIYGQRVRTACSRGVINRDDPPVILTNGPTAPARISALLAACGIAFPADFDLEIAASPAVSIGVWIPNPQS